MSDEVKAPPEKSEETYIEDEVLLDKTRMDIDAEPRLKQDVTKTEIRVDSGAGAGKKSSGFRLPGINFGFITSLFKSRPKTAGKRVSTLPRSLIPYVNTWIAPPGMPFVDQLKFYVLRLVVIGAGFFLFALLLQSCLVALRMHSPFQWILVGATVLVILLSLLSVVSRWSVSCFAGFPVMCILCLLSMHVLLFSTADPVFFTLGGNAPGFVFNELWAGFLLFELVLIIFSYRVRFLKIVLVLALIFGLAGFGYNIFGHVPLEGAWTGKAFWPVFLTLQFVLPVIFIAGLFLIVFFRREIAVGWVVANLVFLLLAGTLGVSILQKNRLPNVISLFYPFPLGVGSAELNDAGGAGRLELKTKNFNTYKSGDSHERYRMTIMPYVSLESPENSVGQNVFRYALKVANISGYPVLSLGKNDFSLTIGGKEGAEWQLKPSGTEKNAYYILTISTHPSGGAETPADIVSFPDKPVYSKDEVLGFALNDSVTPIHSYEIRLDGKSIEKNTAVNRTNFSISLAGLADGSHTVEFVFTDIHGIISRQSREINVASWTGTRVDSPLEGDYFGDFLSVSADVHVPPDFTVLDVRFLVDDQELFVAASKPYQADIDTTGVGAGSHTLKVVANVSRQAGDPADVSQLSQSVSVVKGICPQISFVRPSLGEYLSTEAPIEVTVKADESAAVYELVELFLGEEKIHEWKTAPYTLTWNTANMPAGEYILKVRGKTKGGAQSSDWVRIMTGEGVLHIVPPHVNPDLPNSTLPTYDAHYKKVIFILDASISEEDNLSGKSKWDWQKSVFSMKDVEQKLKDAEVGVVVMGDGMFFQHKDCMDTAWAAPFGKFSPKIKTVLDKSGPRGVTSIFHALSLALKEHPQKIIVLTDGGDSCNGKIPPALEASVRESHVIVDVVVLGEVDAREKEALKQMTLPGGGNYTEVLYGGMLEETISNNLSFVYQLFLGEEILLSAPLDGSPRPLRPGTYDLRIFMTPPFDAKPVVIRNALTTIIGLTADGEKTEANEEIR